MKPRLAFLYLMYLDILNNIKYTFVIRENNALSDYADLQLEQLEKSSICSSLEIVDSYILY